MIYKRTIGSVKFRLKKESKQSIKPIYLDYSFGKGKRLKFAIGYSIQPKYWDEKKLRVKNVVAIRNSNKINDLIRDLESELINFVADCDSKQIEITKDILKKHLKRFTNKSKIIVNKPPNTDLLLFAKTFISQKQKELQGGVKSQTVKAYKQTLNILNSFSIKMNYKLNFNEIDNTFYSSFLDFMNKREYKKGCFYSYNTIGKHIKNIRTFMGAAANADMHSNYKYKGFKILKEQTTAIYLTIDEEVKMLKIDLEKKQHLEVARDIFIIGCEIGQRISDYINLNKYTVTEFESERYIKIKQKKTKKEVLCRITNVIEKIMNERYNGKFPPKITEQKLNKYIKEIGRLAGIDKKIKVERTQGGKKVISYVPKYSLIMGHTARRTFCTLKYKSGVPVHSIMELSGHTTEKEFMKYIRNPKDERVAQITNTTEFINSSIPIEQL